MAAVVMAEEEVQDQTTAEQYFATYGYYPSWYNPSFYANSRSLNSYAYNYPSYVSAGYPYSYTGLRSIAYPTNFYQNQPFASNYPYTSYAYTAPTSYSYRNYWNAWQTQNLKDILLR